MLNETLRGDPPGERVGSTSFVKVALCIVGAAGIAGWLFLAFVHIGDRYKVGHVQGIWMALAQYANEGTLYPPLSDGVRFGGTRNMPLPIIVNATAARLTGEYLVSGKAVAIALFAALLVLTFVVLRQMRCPAPFALALTGLLPATNTGVLVGSAMGGDVLSVLLQVGALVTASVAVRRENLPWMIAAGVLAGVAACSKLTGVWATLGVLSWLGLRRDWQRLAWFVTACCATVAFTLGIIEWASQGRFLTTFLTLTFAGTGGPASWIRAPNQVIFFATQDLLAVWMVAPFAVLGVLGAWHSSALTLYHHALAWSLFLLLIVFIDVGAGLNQLLDPAVLTVAVIGHFASNIRHDRIGGAALGTALAVGVIWAGITGVRGFVPDLREAVASLRRGAPPPQYNPRPLANVVGPDAMLLTEDPGIDVLLGRAPIILDPFMLRRLDQVQPRMLDVLVARIEGGEFAYVALINPLDAEESWWRDYHFGLRLVTALRKSYAFTRTADGYYLYQPRRS